MAWNWGISIITFAFGLGAGFALAFFLIPRSGRIQELEKELDATKSAHSDYRGKVNQHFQKTAELFEDMTDKYRAVYQHMASSAQTLCEERPASLSLEINTRGRIGKDNGKQTVDAETEAADAAPEPPADAPRASDAHDRDEHDDAYGDAPRVPEIKTETETQPGTKTGGRAH